MVEDIWFDRHCTLHSRHGIMTRHMLQGEAKQLRSLIIGMGYAARNGKDTAVAAIIDRYKTDYDVRRYAFADLLKAELYDALLDPLHPFWELVCKEYKQAVQFYSGVSAS